MCISDSSRKRKIQCDFGSLLIYLITLSNIFTVLSSDDVTKVVSPTLRSSKLLVWPSQDFTISPDRASNSRVIPGTVCEFRPFNFRKGNFKTLRFPPELTSSWQCVTYRQVRQQWCDSALPKLIYRCRFAILAAPCAFVGPPKHPKLLDSHQDSQPPTRNCYKSIPPTRRSLRIHWAIE